jgi:hypothetical protein
VQPPPPRQYYSQRNSSQPPELRLTLDQLRQLVKATYAQLNREYYLQQALGYECVDAGVVDGLVGDMDTFVLLRLRRPLWPFQDFANYSEHDLFDILELLYDLVAKPEEGNYHGWDNCGWHFRTFDKEAGQAYLREQANSFLADYAPGYELSEQGEILILGQTDQRELLAAPLPKVDPKNVDDRVEAARHQFRRYGASLEDRRNAVRLLADVLEFLRPKMKEALTSKDEGDLFNIANNFGIRHHNDKQQTDYDQDIWLDWMFYYYLNTIFTVARKIGPIPENEIQSLLGGKGT